MPTCEHGRRRRGCPVCERDEEIAELRADNERLREERWKCQRCGCEFPHTLGDEGVQHCSKCVELEVTAFYHRKLADDNERLRAALLLCRNYADKAMAIDPNDPLAITVEGIAEGRMGPLATEAGGDNELPDN